MTAIYYSLIQIEKNNFTDLKYRMIKNRLKKLIKEGKIKVGKIEDGALAEFKSNKWHIHISLIDLFRAKRRLKTHKKIYYINEITINLHDDHTADYYDQIGMYLCEHLCPYRTIYSVETGKKENSYHIHLGTTAPFEVIDDVRDMLSFKLKRKLCYKKNMHMSKIGNHTKFLNYISKGANK
ncbi:hypothetical protein [Flavobacterium sp. K5-23]|uniref:hypothetical protein n=1 Tax=Flavobacterium sp. K5-23 TaxID=2746225 RepID=UPI00200C0334|nr:hypothetical protein [Flavobacterium sp. K5-23]UQD55758.1 hypothetical protein FLAK523_04840 [Flavobacterium sp. K5-23]